MRSGDARPPMSRPTASTSIDLPAPVSPVRTFKPGSNSTWTASMTARCSICRKRSIDESLSRRIAQREGGELQCYHMFDSRSDAWYSGACASAIATAALAEALAKAVRAVPAAHLLPGGLFAHARTPAPRDAGRGRHCSSTRAQWRLSRPHQKLVADFPVRSRASRRLFDRVVGNHSLQALDVQSNSGAKLALPGNLPTQHQIFRSAGRLPIAQ